MPSAARQSGQRNSAATKLSVSLISIMITCIDVYLPGRLSQESPVLSPDGPSRFLPQGNAEGTAVYSGSVPLWADPDSAILTGLALQFVKCSLEPLRP